MTTHKYSAKLRIYCTKKRLKDQRDGQRGTRELTTEGCPLPFTCALTHIPHPADTHICNTTIIMNTILKAFKN